MDIAALSMSLNAGQLQQNVGIAVLKKSMDAQEVAAQTLIESIEQSTPSFGHQLDIKV